MFIAFLSCNSLIFVNNCCHKNDPKLKVLSIPKGSSLLLSKKKVLRLQSGPQLTNNSRNLVRIVNKCLDIRMCIDHTKNLQYFICNVCPNR